MMVLLMIVSFIVGVIVGTLVEAFYIWRMWR